MKRLALCALILAATPILAPAFAQDTSAQALIEGFSAEAGRPADPEAGKTLFLGTHTGGKPDTPSCTTCHTMDPKKTGATRVGKPIEPMASSVNPSRFTDLAKFEKWIRRNCNSVLGRECTAGEKADVLSWLSSI
jgi:cytochrome c peroxidase